MFTECFKSWHGTIFYVFCLKKNKLTTYKRRESKRFKHECIHRYGGHDLHEGALYGDGERGGKTEEYTGKYRKG